MPTGFLSASVVFTTVGVIFVKWPSAVISGHKFLWVRGGEPTEFGIGMLRFFGFVYLGLAILMLTAWLQGLTQF